MITLRPDSGGLIELELYQTDNPDDEPSIMLNITEPAPHTEHFVVSPETARRLALALLEQVDAYTRWEMER